eukprot:GAHX01008567.1.p1 GENE.GAHX01008567.1~~GAHX01008567.1.p1  ORF type:complete len:54 (+),score=0.64 GAHX01008567.1:64-225(+)
MLRAKFRNCWYYWTLSRETSKQMVIISRDASTKNVKFMATRSGVQANIAIRIK